MRLILFILFWIAFVLGAGAGAAVVFLSGLSPSANRRDAQGARKFLAGSDKADLHDDGTPPASERRNGLLKVPQAVRPRAVTQPESFASARGDYIASLGSEKPGVLAHRKAAASGTDKAMSFAGSNPAALVLNFYAPAPGSDGSYRNGGGE